MEKQTAGREQLGEFAPEFARLNDDVLFGEVWSREDKLSTKNRCMITIAGLIGKGMMDSSFKYHIMNARNHGITKEEMAEIITHLAFYCGWPNAWAAFRVAKEVYAEDDNNEKDSHGGMFGLGEQNTAFAQYNMDSMSGYDIIKNSKKELENNIPIFNLIIDSEIKEEQIDEIYDEIGNKLNALISEPISDSIINVISEYEKTKEI